MTTYSRLRDANLARQAEWDAGNVLTLAYRGNELAGEVGEACNVIKKLERESLGIAGSRDTLAHLAEELADVIICVDLVAMAAGIDMDTAVAAKFNATSDKVGLATRMGPAEIDRDLVDQLTGALRFILAFYEPGQRYLDTNAWTRAEAGGRRALARGEAVLAIRSQPEVPQ